MLNEAGLNAGERPVNDTRRRRVATLLVTLLAGGLLPVSGSGQTPQQACNDPVPKSCARAKFLGENKGCACFVCNPETRASRKVVCTREDGGKKALFKRVRPTAR